MDRQHLVPTMRTRSHEEESGNEKERREGRKEGGSQGSPILGTCRVGGAWPRTLGTWRRQGKEGGREGGREGGGAHLFLKHIELGEHGHGLQVHGEGPRGVG